MRFTLNLFGKMLSLGYEAAKFSTNRGSFSIASAAARDEDALIGPWDRARVRQRCLDLRRNDTIFSSICRSMKDNVVGSGITPQATTSNGDWNEQAEYYWANWTKICDSRGRINFREMQRMNIDALLYAGEIGYQIMFDGTLNPIEAERIATPTSVESEIRKNPNSKRRVVEGIELDPMGKPIAFYVFNRSQDGTINTTNKDYVRVPASDFIYLSNPMRPDQVRGVPMFAPCVNSTIDCKELNSNQLLRSKLDALFSWAITNQEGAAPANAGPRGTSLDATPGATNYKTFEQMQIYYLKEREDIKSLSSNNPGSNYLGFLQQNLRLIGAAVGLPYEFILLDFSQGSFSSSRAALLQAYLTFEIWQNWVSDHFNQRVWNWRIAKAIKAGVLPQAPINKATKASEWWMVDWSYPANQWVDPQNQSAANIQDFNAGAKSLTGIVRKDGKSAEDVLAEKAKDISTAARVAAKANEENAAQGFPTTLTWRDIIATTMPGQVVNEAKPQPDQPVKKEVPA